MVATAASQEAPKSQPPVWSSKPDIPGFEKIENDRLAAAQHSIDEITAGKGARTVDNTLVPYDEALRQINATTYFADLMQQVHPDATFRDHATAMLSKASAASTSLSLNRERSEEHTSELQSL
jgi:thimet oligopeptidase